MNSPHVYSKGGLLKVIKRMKNLYLFVVMLCMFFPNLFGQNYIAYYSPNSGSVDSYSKHNSVVPEVSKNTDEEITVLTRSVDVYLDENGVAVIKPEDVGCDNLSNENVVSMYVFPNRFNKYEIGRNVVELNVKTKSGKYAKSEAVVTVIDNLAPVVKTKNIRLKLNDNESVSIEPSDIDDGSYDNSNIKSFELSKYDFSTKDLGSNLVELSVVDIFGNKSSAVAIVVIEN